MLPLKFWIAVTELPAELAKLRTPVVPLEVPKVGVAEKLGSLPVPWPVRRVPPPAAARVVIPEVPSPIKTPWAASVVWPVPPLATGRAVPE